MVRVYRYRLYPTRVQEAALRETLERLRELYNAALQHRRDAYRKQGESVSAYGQMRELASVREVRPEFASIHTHLLQDAITRLDRAYRAFFRRVKAGETPGFPRFKGRGRYRTFTFKDAANHNGVRLLAGGKRVKLAGIGNVKVKLHRLIEGRIKQASVSLDGDGHWYIAFACVDVPTRPLPPLDTSVGIDVGITTFAALSDGTTVDNPRPYEMAQRSLVTAQRRVSRRKRGSKRRRKAVELLAKQSARVQRVRIDFHHKTAHAIVQRFGSTESAGREFYRVDPRGTSQECSGCQQRVPKGLHVRVHACPHCGLVLDRDVNAAVNVQARGHTAFEEGRSVSAPLNREAPSSRRSRREGR